MKKPIALMLIFCLLLAGCGKEEQVPVTPEALPETSVVTEPTEAAAVVHPLPDTAMDNMTDAVLSVSLTEGDAYVDDTGKMQMAVTVYDYDKYDMVDISMLKVGDILVTHGGEVEIVSLDRNKNGTVLINGGLDENGFDLATDDSGIYYESGYNDTRTGMK